MKHVKDFIQNRAFRFGKNIFDRLTQHHFTFCQRCYFKFLKKEKKRHVMKKNTNTHYGCSCPVI